MNRALKPDLLVLYLVGAGELWPDFFYSLGQLLTL